MRERARSRARSDATSRRRRRRDGFTLVELMVSIVVLTVGMLGMAGTTAVMTRQIGGGSQMALAASTAQTRFEILRSGSCTTATGGTASSRGIAEVWTVTTLSRAVEVTDTVTFTTPRGSRSHAYRTMIPCPTLP